MVVGLLAVVGAGDASLAQLVAGVLLESGCHDGVELLVLAPVPDDLVGVGAVVVALEAVEMGAGLLSFTG